MYKYYKKKQKYSAPPNDNYQAQYFYKSLCHFQAPDIDRLVKNHRINKNIVFMFPLSVSQIPLSYRYLWGGCELELFGPSAGRGPE